jgi:hypothetical protein
VVQRYTTGEQPMRQIAAELGCSYGTVHLLLTRAGTPLRPRGGARRTGGGARVTASNPPRAAAPYLMVTIIGRRTARCGQPLPLRTRGRLPCRRSRCTR